MPELDIALLISDRMILLFIEHQELTCLTLCYCQNSVTRKIRWRTEQSYNIVEIPAIYILAVEWLADYPVLIYWVFAGELLQHTLAWVNAKVFLWVYFCNLCKQTSATSDVQNRTVERWEHLPHLAVLDETRFITKQGVILACYFIILGIIHFLPLSVAR